MLHWLANKPVPSAIPDPGATCTVTEMAGAESDITKLCGAVMAAGTISSAATTKQMAARMSIAQAVFSTVLIASFVVSDTTSYYIAQLVY